MRSIRLLVLACGMAGCSELLPKEDAVTASHWQSFEAAQATYAMIQPGVTDASGLAALGLDPYKDPNIAILNYSDLLRRLAGNASGGADYLDPAVRGCVAEREACRAYEIDIKHIERRREGSFWLDFLNFRRVTNVEGWRFNAVFVLQGERVVYKLWSGQPTIREAEDVRHPLGPLQGIGESLRPSIN